MTALEPAPPATASEPPTPGRGRRPGQRARFDAVIQVTRRVLGPPVAFIRQDNAMGRFVRALLGSVVFLVVVQAYFHLALGYLIDGIALGSLYGILGVALILIYRTNRIINFAAAAIGAVPAIWALLLDVQDHHSYLVVLPIVVIGAPLLGALIDIAIMRRFARSPRLIATVVTLGLAQALASLGFFIPVWMGAKAGQIPNVPTPWDGWKLADAHGKPVLTGNEIAAFATVIILSIALGLFLRYTRIGIALRASAENADRASLLGIPVKRVGMVAWMLAGLFGGMTIFVQAPLIGVPNNATLGFDALLYGLAAAVVARMERLGIALLAGAGVGILVFGSVAKNGDNNLASALMLIVILGALLLQRGTMSRAMDTGVSTWQAVKHFRPVPSELRGLPEVGIAQVALFLLAAVVAIGLPFVINAADLPFLIVLPLFGIVAVSLVVLTGWAGQISLGQFGLVGVSAGIAGGLVANHNIDFFVAIGIGIAAGVVAAVIIGLPAVRIQGMYLAVTTLAFGFAVQKYVLNRHYWLGRHILPSGLTAHLLRPTLYQRINLENDRTFYFVCVIFLVLSMLAANSFRKNRSGRILIAARDNQRAAPAYAVNLVRTRLAAFAVAGGIAGLAGTLFAYAQHNVVPDSYDVLSSLLVFLSVVIGGLTSLPFAVLGAMFGEALVLFGTRLHPWLGDNLTSVLPLLLTGPLLILNLYFYPGGSAENGFAIRDKYLRWVARRHDILVPSLVADRLVAEEPKDLITQAEAHVEQVQSFDVSGKIACPVCNDLLTLDEAAHHDHLQPALEAADVAVSPS